MVDFFISSTLLLGNAGCATSKPNPLTGWNFCPVDEEENFIKAVSDDYHNYIEKLSPKVRYYVQEYNISFFKDATGQHAVKIEIPLNGVYVEHVLFYDKENKRVNVIVYSGGRYAS